MQHRSTYFAIAAAFAALLLAPRQDAAAATLVAVTPFGGPGQLAREAHAAVVAIVASEHRVVSSAEILRASATAGGDVRVPATALRVGRLAGADALVTGNVEEASDGFKLAISVRDAKSGRSIGEVLVPMLNPVLVSTDASRIQPLVLNLLAQLDPSAVSDGLLPKADARRDEEISTSFIRGLSKPLPISFRASVGANMTRRSLQFKEETGVDSKAGLKGSPSAGFRFNGEVTSKGNTQFGVAFGYDAALGARISFGNEDSALDLPIRQKRWNLSAIGRTQFRGAKFSGSLGYAVQEVAISPRPVALRTPNTYYGSASLGGGGRYGFRADTMAVFGSLRYLHAVSTSGITSTETFGSARVRGLDADAGFEYGITPKIWARAGMRMSRFSVRFKGNGIEASELDDDPGQDVSGATDSVAGLYAQLTFRL